MKHLKLYNESIRNMMTSKSDVEVNINIKKNLQKLEDIFKKDYSDKWIDVKHYLDRNRQNTIDSFLKGWSLEEVVDEYSFGVQNYLGELEMDNDKFIKEGLRDQMKPKSEEEVMSSIMKLTPYGMQWKINDMELELDDYTHNKLQKISEERIDEAEEDLESIFKMYVDTDRQTKTLELFNDAIKWVERNGGNKENLIEHGIKDFAEQIENSFQMQNRFDWEQLYSYDSVFLFQKLLKQLAIDEALYNNINYEH